MRYHVPRTNWSHNIVTTDAVCNTGICHVPVIIWLSSNAKDIICIYLFSNGRLLKPAGKPAEHLPNHYQQQYPLYCSFCFLNYKCSLILDDYIWKYPAQLHMIHNITTCICIHILLCMPRIQCSCTHEGIKAGGS